MVREHPLLSAKMLAVLAVLGVLWGGGMALVLADRLSFVGIAMGFLASVAIISIYAKPLRHALETGEWDGPEMPSKTELIIAVVCAAGAPLVIVSLYLFPANNLLPPPLPVGKADILPSVSPPVKQAPGELTPISPQALAPQPQAPAAKVAPKELPGAKWIVTDLALDPPFDETNLKPTYKVKITVRNDGEAASSNPSVQPAVIVPPAPLDRNALDQQFESVAKSPPDVDFLSHTSASVDKGQTLTDDLSVDIPQQSARAVHEGLARLYVPLIISWVDSGTPRRMYRTREFCGYVGRAVAPFSYCDYHNTEPRLKYLPAGVHQPQGLPAKPKE